MPDLAKTLSPRPPPLPTPTPGRGRAVDRAKASLEIGRMRLSDRLRRVGGALRRHPIRTTLAALLIAAAVGAAVAFTLDLDVLPDLPFLTPATVADASARAKAHPDDAVAQRDLGHALWSAHKRGRAIAAYARALAKDPGVADERMVDDLVAAFATRHQDRAARIIVKHRLKAAEKGLVALTRSPRRSVRWEAVRTLDRLGEGTMRSWENVYIADLDSQDCDVRRAAVTKLGEIGTRRSIPALRSARPEDEKTGGLFKSRCLGDRLEDAEQRILARR